MIFTECPYVLEHDLTRGLAITQKKATCQFLNVRLSLKQTQLSRMFLQFHFLWLNQSTIFQCFLGLYPLVNTALEYHHF